MIEVIVPLEQEGTEAVVSNWLCAKGDRVALNDPLVELETDKVSVEVPAPVEGIVEEILIDPGASAKPGQVLARIRALIEVVSGTAPATQVAPACPPAAEKGTSKWHSPAVRKALAETGLDPEVIHGTGRGGRLTLPDVKSAALSKISSEAERNKPAVPEAPVAAPAAWENDRRPMVVPHDAMRLAIARNMMQSVQESPQVTAVFEADFSAIVAHRAKAKPLFKAEGINLSYSSYLLAAAARAMQAVPQANSRWHDDRLEIFGEVNIGIGTALGDKGLVVPVIPRVQNLSLHGIAKALQDVTRRARHGKLT